MPTWAFLQVEDLGYLKRLVNWYIDNRQIANGEFGGGLSDDSDFLNWWPGLRSWVSTPDKIKASLLKTMDAMYDQHMFTNGLATIQTDELHSYEDGFNVLGQAMQIDFGSPKQIERAMETARRLEWLTGDQCCGTSADSFGLLQWGEDVGGGCLGMVEGQLVYGLSSCASACALQRRAGDAQDGAGACGWIAGASQAGQGRQVFGSYDDQLQDG